MLKVRRYLCRGCGLCIRVCPTGAILLNQDHAEINHSLCNQCRLCLELCPQGAIVDLVPASKGELQVTVASLKQKTNNLIERIEELKQRSK